jgi:hypothetical protein
MRPLREWTRQSSRFLESDVLKLSTKKDKPLQGLLSKLSDSLRPVQLKLDGIALKPGDVELPMKEPQSVEGIISYLTKKHRGNVHEKGIVIMTAKSISGDPVDALKNLADLREIWRFYSKNEPGQWVCCDFRQRRVCLAHSTICAEDLKSWALEGSLDGENWTEIDRQTNNEDFHHSPERVSFAIPKGVESRFIRLTQTDKNHSIYGDRYGDRLALRVVFPSKSRLHSALFIFLYSQFCDPYVKPKDSFEKSLKGIPPSCGLLASKFPILRHRNPSCGLWPGLRLFSAPMEICRTSVDPEGS